MTEYLRLEHVPPIEYSVLLKTSDKKIAEFLLSEDGVWYCLIENNGLHPDYILIELGTKLKQLNDETNMLVQLGRELRKLNKT